MKIAIIDLETTGLEPKDHEIIEIGCVIFDDRTFKILDTLDIKVKPQHIERATKQALSINGYKKEDWVDAVSIEEAIRQVRSIANNAIFCSYPVTFDYPFIREAGMHWNFNRYKICLFSMVYSRFGACLSLKNACEKFGIEPEPDIHRAINGAMAGYKLYKALHDKT